ncbi:non-specific serine/threonine protein kinase [Comamonas sp. BIGb0152]|uniref:serine/threonine protein kinase n=1 Tax=Comamonas sp. BIGb0152 TaxID=2940601 RepID=UPI00216868B3|nr:serine/threonine protein kinase [Comamonas sp. BIGb0152]MCS4292945.1 non-specific serine/threonine protein kinase [Comamonas sp. BIGb0152]
MSLAIGTRLHEFELLNVIGEGGFSIVYLAYDHSLQRTVAIKEYLPGAIALRDAQGLIRPRYEKYDATFHTGLQSFLNEARILAQFEHPALIRIHRFWEQNGTAYMVMQYCAGKTLRKLLLAEPERHRDEHWLKIQVMEPVLDALQLLHSRHYYHRDLSPDNIIVLDAGMPMLLDFGAARQVIGDMTQALTVILKPGFAPIEQYADDESMRQGPWTDIYGVGAVMYFAVTGKAPVASVARLVKDPLKKLAQLDPAPISAAFAQTIDHALAVFPNDRPQSIEQLRHALRQPGGAAAVPGAVVPSAPPVEAARHGTNPEVAEPLARQAAPLAPASPQAQAPAGTLQTTPTAPTAPTAPGPSQPQTQAAQARQETVPSPTSEALHPTAARKLRHRRWALALGLMALLLVLGTTLSWWLDRSPTAPAQVAAASDIGTTPMEPADSASPGWHAISAQEDTLYTDAPTGEAAATMEWAEGSWSGGKPATSLSPAVVAAEANHGIADDTHQLMHTPPSMAGQGQGNTQETLSPATLPTPAVAHVAPPLAAPAPSEPHATAAEARPGAYLRLSIQPWGRVVIDGEEKGISPPMTRIWLAEGRHQVVIVNGDLQKHTESVHITNKQDLVLAHKF